MKPHVSMICLGVADVVASRRFYEEGLGLPCLDSPPGIAFFNLNGTWLGLSQRDDLAKDAGVAAPHASGFRGVTLAHNVASEGAVNETVTEAEQAGGKIIKPPARADWGGYHAYFEDPDGHVWEVAHNPFVAIGPQDDGASSDA